MSRHKKTDTFGENRLQYRSQLQLSVRDLLMPLLVSAREFITSRLVYAPQFMWSWVLFLAEGSGRNSTFRVVDRYS